MLFKKSVILNWYKSNYGYKSNFSKQKKSWFFLTNATITVKGMGMKSKLIIRSVHTQSLTQSLGCMSIFITGGYVIITTSIATSNVKFFTVKSVSLRYEPFNSSFNFSQVNSRGFMIYSYLYIKKLNKSF